MMREVRDLKIKEMPIEEKYDKLLDSYILGWIANYSLNKELGAVDKSINFSVEMQKKLLPSVWGPLFNLLKALTPGRVFKQIVEQYVYNMQSAMPLSNIELSWVSDRELVLNIKNCPALQRGRELVKKTGVKVDPRELCEVESKINKELTKEFGVDLAWKQTENGCTWTAKLK